MLKHQIVHLFLSSSSFFSLFSYSVSSASYDDVFVWSSTLPYSKGKKRRKKNAEWINVRKGRNCSLFILFKRRDVMHASTLPQFFFLRQVNHTALYFSRRCLIERKRSYSKSDCHSDYRRRFSMIHVYKEIEDVYYVSII